MVGSLLTTPAGPGSRLQRSAHIAPARSIEARGATANIPNMIRRKKRLQWTKALYRARNLVERFFNKLNVASLPATTSLARAS
jgi:hypothetical protein